jgi:hypothetical protein
MRGKTTTTKKKKMTRRDISKFTDSWQKIMNRKIKTRVTEERKALCGGKKKRDIECVCVHGGCGEMMKDSYQ